MKKIMICPQAENCLDPTCMHARPHEKSVHCKKDTCVVCGKREWTLKGISCIYRFGVQCVPVVRPEDSVLQGTLQEDLFRL